MSALELWGIAFGIAGIIGWDAEKPMLRLFNRSAVVVVLLGFAAAAWWKTVTG